MTESKRIVANTSAQYIKTIISGILTLYATRIILSNLGVNDYGLFSLIAGVVSMLSFITTALSSTTQRFLSFYQGKKETSKGKIVFCSSFYLHLILGIFIVLCLLFLIPILFNGFLNIPSERINAAKAVYCFVILSLFTSFITSPFKASLIAHENIVFTSIIETIDSALKLFIAILLSYFTYDKLVVYGFLLWIIQLLNLIVFTIYALSKYPECIIPNIHYIDTKYLTELGHFAGWSIFNIACTIGRTQGLAIVLNKLLGTVANAAYGLSIHINSYVNYISESLLCAIRPQIVKAEGAQEREKMFKLSELASKYSFFLLSMFSVPIIAEMPFILQLWLGQVPELAILFCRMMLIAGVIDTLSTGLSIANQAIGDLKIFSFYIYLPKLIIIPLSVIALHVFSSPLSVAYIYIIIELLCALMRIFLMNKYNHLNIKSFFQNVFLRITVPSIILLFGIFIIVYNINCTYRFLITLIIPNILYLLAIYYFGINYKERMLLKNILSKIIFKRNCD